MINIRKAKLEDLNAVHKIELLSFAEGSYPIFVLRQLFDIAKDYFLVAEKEGELLGYVIGSVTRKLNQGWVLSLGVSPEARGKRIGYRLTKSIVEVLEQERCSEICLTVHPDNKAAINIYKNVGFEITLESDNYYMDHEARFLMTKKHSNCQSNI